MEAARVYDAVMLEKYKNGRCKLNFPDLEPVILCQTYLDKIDKALELAI